MPNAQSRIPRDRKARDSTSFIIFLTFTRSPMAKNIAFFSDGTWNGPGQDDNNDGVPDPTNVFFLFDQLEGADTPETKLLQDEQEQIALASDGSCTQISKYLH